MKLLYCKNCHDIIKLRFMPRFCECERIGGVYINVLDIAIFGEKDLAVPLGITNPSFYNAIDNQPEEDTGDNGEIFLSFVIPSKCRKVMHMNIKDFNRKEVPTQFRFNFLTKDEYNRKELNRLVKETENENKEKTITT